MIAILTITLITFCTSLFFVLIVIKLAQRYSWYDHIDERKIHSGSIPRLGGVGFICAYMLILIVLLLSSLWQQYTDSKFIIPVLFAMLLILIFGIWDDFKPLRARYKFLVQFVAALLIVLTGYTFKRISFSEININFVFSWFSYPLTIIWIMGIINAVNLIDGVDGLAGGISVIIITAYAVIYIALGNIQGVLLCILLIAAIFGFLMFNFPMPRAKIFMGDTGSQFLGFFIAMIPLLDTAKLGRASVPLPYAAGLTLIPIFDTFAAIWRRTRDGRGIYEPDREHTHHKLLALGFRAIQIDAILYSVQLLSAACIVLALTILSAYRLPLLIVAYTIVTVFFTILHYAYKHKVKEKQGKA